tara:strand:- start:764 stop:2092 length:1329 start_codon:yes stop_codon:yes gene_type:complete
MISIKHPPSIISIDTSNCNEEYNAYVYKYTNITNGMWYVGWHPGMFDGSYWHSSKNEEFIKVFSGSKPVLTLEILSTGLIINMKNLESKILTDQKVKKNSLSYNQAGAPTGSKEPIDIEKCHSFIEFLKNKIKNGEVQEENFDTIKNLPRLQVRSKGENNEHIGRIRDGMRETGLEKQNPILIWEGVEPKTKSDMIGNGNHTIKAIEGLINFNQINTVRSTQEEISDWNLNLDEMRYIGNLLNPREEVPKLETDEDDAIKLLIGQKEKGVAISGDNCDYGVRLIKGMGFKFKRPGSIVKKAETLYTAKIRAKSGQKIAQYDKNHQDNLKHLQRKADSLRNDHTIVIQMGTAYPSKIIRAIFEAILDKESYSNRYAIQLVYFHNADSSMEKWDGGEHASVKRIVRGVLEEMGPLKFKDDNGNIVDMKRTFHTHGMPHTQSDIS